MKRSEVNLKKGDKVVVDFSHGAEVETTYVLRAGTPGYVRLGDPAGIVPYYVVTYQGIDNLSGSAYRVIEVNGEAVEED